MKYLRLVALFGIIFSYSSVSSAQDWDVVQVASPLGGSAALIDINNSGSLVGNSYEEYLSSHYYLRPVLVTANSSSFLAFPPNNYHTGLTGINDTGMAVGYSSVGPNFTFHAQKWENGNRVSLGGFQDYDHSYAIDANDSGKIIGFSRRNNSSQSFPWVWENGVFTALPLLSSSLSCEPAGINNSGIIIGNCYDENTFREVRFGIAWDLSHVISQLHGTRNIEGDSSTAFSINDRGEIAGGLVTGFTTRRAVVWPTYSSSPAFLQHFTKNLIGEKYFGVIPVATSINNIGNIVGLFEAHERGGSLTNALYWYTKDSIPINLSKLANVHAPLPVITAHSLNSCSQILVGALMNPPVPDRINSFPDTFYLNPTGCICGVNTQDANNNKIIDCMEPTAATKPPAPVIGVKGARVFVNVAVPPPGMGYKTVVQVYNSKNKRIGRKTASGSQVEFKKLFGRTRKGQRLTVKANIYWTNGTITTQTSKRITKKFRVK